MNEGKPTKAKTHIGWTILACAWALQVVVFLTQWPNQVRLEAFFCELGLLGSSILIGIVEDLIYKRKGLMNRALVTAASLVFLAVTFPAFAQAKSAAAF